ncbi:hypothetical protein BGX28_007432 [Mortierella sp. GBA30]|nr:hypothetical protein BGX28_007432 [Mortierella sp. GBA30]
MPTATKLTPVDTSTPNYTVSPRPTRLRHCATKAKPKKDWPLVPPFPSKNGPSDVANVDQSESPATVTPHLSQQATIPCPHALQMHSAKRSRLSRSQYTPETDPSVPSLSQALVPSRSASPWTSPSPPPCSGYSPRDPRLRRLNSPVLPAETPDDQAQEVQATFKIPAIHIRQRDVLQLTLVHPREERCAHDIDRIIRLMEAHLSLDVRIARDVWYLEHRKGQSAILWFQLQGIKEKRQLSDSPSPQPSISSAVPSGATTTSSTLLAHNYLGSLPQQVLSDVSPFQFQCAPTLSLQWSIALGLAVGSHLPRSATKHGLVKLIQGVRFEGNKQHDLTFSLTEQELRCHLHAPSLYVLAYSATTNAPPPLDCVQDQETVMSSLLAHAGPHESIARKPLEVEDDWVPQAFGRFFGANTAPPRPNIVISPNTRTTVSPQKHPSLEISREMVDIIVKELKLSTPTGSKTQSQLTVEQAYQEHLQPRDDLAKQSTGVQTEEFGGVPVSVQDKAILQLIPDLTTMSNLIRNSRQSIDLEESDEEDGGSMIVRSIM